MEDAEEAGGGEKWVLPSHSNLRWQSSSTRGHGDTEAWCGGYMYTPNFCGPIDVSLYLLGCMPMVVLRDCPKIWMYRKCVWVRAKIAGHRNKWTQSEEVTCGTKGSAMNISVA